MTAHHSGISIRRATAEGNTEGVQALACQEGCKRHVSNTTVSGIGIGKFTGVRLDIISTDCASVNCVFSAETAR